MALQGSAVRIRLAPLIGEPSKFITRKAFGNSERFLKVFCVVNKYNFWADIRMLLSSYAHAIVKQSLFVEC
jgi:hypothetical protein